MGRMTITALMHVLVPVSYLIGLHLYPLLYVVGLGLNLVLELLLVPLHRVRQVLLAVLDLCVQNYFPTGKKSSHSERLDVAPHPRCSHEMSPSNFWAATSQHHSNSALTSCRGPF